MWNSLERQSKINLFTRTCTYMHIRLLHCGLYKLYPSWLTRVWRHSGIGWDRVRRHHWLLNEHWLYRPRSKWLYRATRLWLCHTTRLWLSSCLFWNSAIAPIFWLILQPSVAACGQWNIGHFSSTKLAR